MAEYTKKLSAANIKYILVINDLQKKGMEQVRNIDVAKQLHLSKPSVHTMLNALSEMNVITKEQNGIIQFTAEGKRLAERYNEYFNAWKCYLNKDISDSERRKSAICAIIAELSEEENRKISKQYK